MKYLSLALAFSILVTPTFVEAKTKRKVTRKLTAAEKKDCSVVRFSANWCGPCLRMKPNFETEAAKKALSKYRKNTVGTKATNPYWGKHYFHIDSDQDRNRADSWQLKYRVVAIPTVLILDKNNRVVRRAEGYMSEAQLINFLDNASVTTVNDKVVEETFTFGAVTALKWVIILLARGILFFLG